MRAVGRLTDATRTTIREHKATILAELAAVAANDCAPTATPEQAAELRRLVAIVAADWPADEQAEALAVALADPEAALECFRVLAAERVDAPPPAPKGDDRMRTCRQCANLAPGGRCLAAWRGEDFGLGIAVGRDFTPLEPDRPQRCLAHSPGPEDADRRSGRERWAFQPSKPRGGQAAEIKPLSGD